MAGSFLQSSEWEEFQKKTGRKTWRVDGSLVIRHDLPGGFNYLYCPRPKPVTGNWLLEVAKTVQGERSIFLKADPIEKFKIQNSKFKISESRTIQPQKTAVLDLQKSEEELLAAMHEKTRYNIRLAEKRGVVVNQRPTTYDQQPFEVFWKLLQETARRDGFRTHEKRYYEKLLAVRSKNFSNELFFAAYQDKIPAAAMVNFYRGSTSIGSATYLHGASSREYKEVMAPYLLHWRIIQEAKKRGFNYYDFWGIDEERWPGLTRFKKGFGGGVVEYPPSVDIVYRPWLYRAYSIVRRFKSKITN